MGQVVLDSKNLKLRGFLELMQDPRREALLAIYDDYRDIFHHAAGSSHNHQAWSGGYADHIAETFRIHHAMWHGLSQIRALPFSYDSAIIALFFHDIEKPFRYGPLDHEECNKWRAIGGDDWVVWEDLKWAILEEMVEKYGFFLNKDEMNALKFTHGEGDKHQKNERVSLPLAAHVHHCDNASARIFFSDGQGLG